MLNIYNKNQPADWQMLKNYQENTKVAKGGSFILFFQLVTHCVTN